MRRNQSARVVIVFVLSASGLLAEERIDVAELGEFGASWTNGLDVTYGVYGAWAVGDVDADGFGEILLQALEENPSAPQGLGWVSYLIHGQPRVTGEMILSQELRRTWQIRVTEPPEDWLGPCVVDASPAGDVNADGYADFLLGYGLYPDKSAPGSGLVLLIHGGSDLQGVARFEDLVQASRTTVFRSTEPTYQALGWRCQTAGDFDGDGEQDFVIAAPNSRLGSALDQAQGAVFLVFGGLAFPREVDVAKVGGVLRGVRIEGFEEFRDGLGRVNGVSLGEEIAPLGDFDGDRRADLAVVASDRWPRSIYIILGQAQPPPVIALIDAQSYPNVIEIRGPSVGIESWFGHDHQVAGLGDVNGDGLSDLAVSRAIQSYSIKNPLGSFVQVFLGSAQFPRQVSFDALDETLGVTLEPHEEGALFGRYIASAGDFDGDGRPDILIGAPMANPERRTQAGEALVLLSRAGFGESAVLRGSFPGTRILGRGPFEALGNLVGPAGDFDGDGFDDILAISRRVMGSTAREAYPGSCRAYLVYGGLASEVPLDLFGVQPPFGPQSGGSAVRLSGSGFTRGVRVTVDGIDASDVDVRSSTLLDVVTPPGTRGLADVSVSLGRETSTLPNHFFYSTVMPVDLDALGPRGFTIQSKENMDLGSTAASGDFNGDGIDDLVFSACRAGWIEGNRGCKAVLVRGSRVPTDLTAFEVSERVTSIRLPRETAWLVVSALGDVDGDRREDFLIALDSGFAYLVRGQSQWPAETSVEDLFLAGNVTEINLPEQDPVPAVSLGDLNGDGSDDFALSMAGRGAVNGERELVFIAGRREWDSDLDLPAESSGRVVGGGAITELGWEMVAAGDVNGDRLSDLLANSEPGARQTAYLIHGSPLLLTGGTEDLGALVAESARARSFLTISDNRNWGLTVSGAGDVNRDGHDDFLLGLPHGAEIIRGRSYLIFGSPSLDNLEITDGGEVPEGVTAILGDRVPHQNAYVAPCGDLDGDGFDDFSVSSPIGILPEPGYIYVVKGKARFPSGIELGKPGLESFRIEGMIPLGILIGYPSGVGDYNGDGADDFMFRETSHPDAPGHPAAAGRVYVILGGARGAGFIRGDANADSVVNLTDPVVFLQRLFAGGRALPCDDAGDGDDDGLLTLTDAIYLLNHLFRSGPAPLAPYPTPGVDPTEDTLGCDSLLRG
jgi:hypothetical protein